MLPYEGTLHELHFARDELAPLSQAKLMVPQGMCIGIELSDTSSGLC